MSDILAELARTPDRVRRFASVPVLERVRPAAGGFAFVEHFCHLRDIEIEGYAVRIRRMAGEAVPALADVDGARLARERDYFGRGDAARALDAFAHARRENLERLAAADWTGTGDLEGAGIITLADLAARMLQHDRDHLAEMESLWTELTS